MKGGQRARAAGVVGDAALAAGHAGAASAVLRAPEADELCAALAAANHPFRRDASDASSSTEAPPTTDEGRDDPANDWVLCD